jgi:hypothetical protein
MQGTVQSQCYLTFISVSGNWFTFMKKEAGRGPSSRTYKEDESMLDTIIHIHGRASI